MKQKKTVKKKAEKDEKADKFLDWALCIDLCEPRRS